MKTKTYNLYRVGGWVRDFFLSLPSKDIDYTFEFVDLSEELTPLEYFNKMNKILTEDGFTIHHEVPDAFTSRGKFPIGHEHEKLTADFVMARKETYPDGDTRMPVVEMGTLYHDLQRRDFRMNAIALADDGEIIDPFNGRDDINKKLISCPIDAETSFNDDPLRAIRAVRFALTKGFRLKSDVAAAMYDFDMWDKFDKVVSRERVREELFRMFKFNTLGTLDVLKTYIPMSAIKDVIFKDDLWLKPTNESR